MTAHGLGALAQVVRGLGLLLLLPVLACHPRPSTVAEAQQASGDPDGWFGEGVQFQPGSGMELVWAEPGLNLSGQAVEMAEWEAPDAPGPGQEAGPSWIAGRDALVRELRTLTAESIGAAQEPRPPAGTPPAYRLEGRVLAFGKEARVAAKTGQVLGNLVLLPLEVFITHGAAAAGIEGVSGYRTEVLFQVKLVDLITRRTVLAIHCRRDFKSLEAPVELAAAIWELSGGANWWPAQALDEHDGDRVWFRPDLDLRGARIRCLAWLPGYSHRARVREKDIGRGVGHRMPGLLVDANDEGLAGPILSETAGDLYLQGEELQGAVCRAKLWDPATRETLGLMEVGRGLWPTGAGKDWARRILGQLRNQRPDGNQEESRGFWRKSVDQDWLQKYLRKPAPAPG